MDNSPSTLVYITPFHKLLSMSNCEPFLYVFSRATSRILLLLHHHVGWKLLLATSVRIGTSKFTMSSLPPHQPLSHFSVVFRLHMVAILAHKHQRWRSSQVGWKPILFFWDHICLPHPTRSSLARNQPLPFNCPVADNVRAHWYFAVQKIHYCLFNNRQCPFAFCLNFQFSQMSNADSRIEIVKVAVLSCKTFMPRSVGCCEPCPTNQLLSWDSYLTLTTTISAATTTADSNWYLS